MAAYGDLFSFYVMFIVLTPAIILGLLGKKIKYYGLFATFIMIALFIGNSRRQIFYLVAFYIGQLIIVKGYFFVRRKSDSIWLMRFAILFSILPLIIVKLNPYITKTTLGFIGISYITFRVVQIVIETHDGLINDMNILDFTYFLLFFPTLTSGPVDRSRSFENVINNKISKEIYANEYLAQGFFKIIKGAAYKFIVAMLINSYWMELIPNSKSFSHVISYMYAYSLYLFFDFAGYSSMAIGTSYILGVKAPENFDAPFISRNMKEFWNRWHMSLSFWFRDFIYTRFTMGFMKKKRFKSRFTASYVAYLITMVTMGLWHGFKLFYVIYGLYMALTLILTDFVQRKSKLYKKHKNKTWWKLSAIALNFNVACFGLLLFSGYLFNK